jgi:hypothetical protein
MSDSVEISAPVGRGVSLTGRTAVNDVEDVQIVQELLNLVSPAAGGPHPQLTITGKVDDATYDAIVRFQKRQFGWSDGVVDPDKVTYHRLNAIAAHAWPPNRDDILRDDIQQARAIAMKCVAWLRISNPIPQNKFLTELLQDTFAIDGSDAEQVDILARRFVSFAGRMDTVKFTFTTDHATTRDHQGHAAFVKYVVPLPFAVNEIFITPGYFGNGNPVDRAVALIHEHIHLTNAAPGHPGVGGLEGSQAPFGRAALGIEFENAAVNPYCYESFAKWLWIPVPRPKVTSVD